MPEWNVVLFFFILVSRTVCVCVCRGERVTDRENASNRGRKRPGGRGSGCAVAGFGLAASLVLEATSDTSREE